MVVLCHLLPLACHTYGGFVSPATIRLLHLVVLCHLLPLAFHTYDSLVSPATISQLQSTASVDVYTETCNAILY